VTDLYEYRIVINYADIFLILLTLTHIKPVLFLLFLFDLFGDGSDWFIWI